MSQNIQAIYKNGVFHPLQPIDLPEGSIVWIKILGILEDNTDSIKNIEKDLSNLEESERKHLEKEIDN